MSAPAHKIHDLGQGRFLLSWTSERRYPGSWMPQPVSCSRKADKAGAERFSAKWSVPMPASPVEAPASGVSAATVQLLWGELAAMAARARQMENWHLMENGCAQDLLAAEAALRQTREEVQQAAPDATTAPSRVQPVADPRDAEIARLKALLKPFASMGKGLTSRPAPDEDTLMMFGSSAGPQWVLMRGHFRAATTAFNEADETYHGQ